MSKTKGGEPLGYVIERWCVRLWNLTTLLFLAWLLTGAAVMAWKAS